ncbi:MAG TPA: diguanylate cyclase [Mycobacteriales bacterium]|nr:diguanylate cyclase [Mycobacteriales bacterium]
MPSEELVARPARVLLVEDDHNVQQLGRFILEDVGYTVDAASTCAEARELLGQEATPDVVLLDVHLPDGNGLDVLTALMGDPRTASIPVIVVTGSIQAGAVRAFDAGAHDYLAKPFEPEEMLARVRAALRVKQARDELVRLATRDSLTALPNRRALDDTLAEAVGHCARHEEPLSVALLDVVNFKAVNDVHGHAMGDQVLCQVARCLEGNRRIGDVIGRWGGDEFLAILPRADEEAATKAVQRLQRAVVRTVQMEGRLVELRAGIATSPAGTSVEAEELVRRAASTLRDVHAQG